MAKSGLKRALAILLAAAIALVAIAGFAVCSADASAYAFVAAGNYGGTDATSLWYYGQDALNVYDAVDAVGEWKDGLSGDPVVIAVVDTGITAKHGLFDDVLLTNAAGETLGTNSTVADGKEGSDDISDRSRGRHGNKIAGTIAMLIHEFGLEDFIKIYPIKASVQKTVDNQQEDIFSIEYVIEALRRATEKAGADIINLSFGTTYGKTHEWAENATLSYTVEQTATSSFIVAAAGNNSQKANTQLEDSAFYPAALDGVFSVMGYDSSGELYKNSNYGALYDLAAPAEDIYSATDVYGSADGYGTDSGTSMASATVAFAAALVKLRYRAENLAEPSPQMIARLLKSFDFDSFEYNGTDIHRLDLMTIVSQPIDEINFNFNPPTGVKITHDGQTGGTNNDTIYYKDPRYVPEINFVANLSPYGLTDPEFDEHIEWVLVDSAGVETVLGTGKTLKYKPSVFGETQLVARLRFNTSYAVQGVQKIKIEYLKYVAADAVVTYAEYSSASPKSAPTSGTLYTGATTVFSFTGIDYLDPNVEIKWYVDRQYVASGRTFAYKPTKAGQHVISVQYGDNPPVVNPGVAFVADVKPFILRPLDLSMLVIGIAIAVAVAATLIAVRVKRKKASEQPQEKRPKPKKPKKEKPDKNVKIAKR